MTPGRACFGSTFLCVAGLLSAGASTAQQRPALLMQLLAMLVVPHLLLAQMGSRPPVLITVGRNVQVTRDRPADTFTEVLLSADPVDPNRLISCGILYVPGTFRRETVLYLSTDRGATWQPVFNTGDFRDSSDPACTFGSGELAFHVTLTSPDVLSDSIAVWSYRSTNGGRTWQRTADLWSKMGGLDRESITVDTASRSPYRGRVYVNGSSAVLPLNADANAAVGWAIALYVSNDSGRTYRLPIQRFTTTSYVLGIGNSVVLSDGTLISLSGELRENAPIEPRNSTKDHPNADLKAVISTDGGDSYGPAVTVSDWYLPWNTPFGCCSPYLASDPGSTAFKDRLYAVFTDERSGRPEILLCHSADKGRTWSEPIVVNDDRAGLDPVKGPRNFLPVVAVNRDGVVGVSWYHTANPQGNPGWEVRFAASLDGGETWSPSVAVSAQPARYDANAAVHAATDIVEKLDTASKSGLYHVDIHAQGRQFFGGDYAGLAADAGGIFHSLWVDNRTGYSQIWTTPVTVAGRVLKHGAPDLAELDDLAPKIAFVVSNTRFDRLRNEVTVTAKLRNVSKDTLRGPVKVRLVRLRSELGVPAVVGAENGVAGPGAVWDFTPALPGGALVPAAESSGKQLTFRLSEFRSFLQGEVWKTHLVTFDARVLGVPMKRSTAAVSHSPSSSAER